MGLLQQSTRREAQSGDVLSCYEDQPIGLHGRCRRTHRLDGQGCEIVHEHIIGMRHGRALWVNLVIVHEAAGQRLTLDVRPGSLSPREREPGVLHLTTGEVPGACPRAETALSICWSYWSSFPPNRRSLASGPVPPWHPP